MDNILIKRISADLGIHRYNGETEEEYGHRLIYSALAAWARTLVLGESYTDLGNEMEEAYYHNVDRMHIQARLSQIAYGLLSAIPYCDTWIEGSTVEDQSSQLASQIIENLIFCYELSPLNNPRRLTIAPSRIINFKNVQLILGYKKLQDTDNKVKCAGVGRWILVKKEAENFKDVFSIPNYIHDDYYFKLLDSAHWQEIDFKGNYKIFKTGTGRFYSKAWRDCNIEKLPHGISLLRSDDVDGGYLLAKREGNRTYIAPLDKWYYEEKELYRLMYILDKHNGTPAVFKAQIYTDHVLLHCHSLLPNPEMRVLILSSWPKRSYKDIFYRIVPIFIWEELKMILTDLGIKIECEYN